MCRTAKHPEWLDNAVFYEIYPQSFMDSNGDGIGDFKGIISKLDYIKELGCNAIWLNPCFKSPFGDAGYDVEDYFTAAERYGTNQDLYDLFEEVHKRGMHVILDLVPGHTAVTHPWFRQSMKAEKNEFTHRYIWSDSIWENTAPLECIRGISDRDGSAAVNFFSHQPALNYGYFRPEKSWQHPMDSEDALATAEAIKEIMRFWLKAGCDGFRVDMAGSLVKNDNENSDGNVALWKNFREFLDREFPDAAMISEWGEPDKSLRGGFHMDFLLHFGSSHYNDLFRCAEPYFSSRGRGDITEFLKKYIENREKTDGKGLICIPSGNHDMDRLRRHLDTEEMKIAFAFLLTMPGAPFIYYGDEIGMRYVENVVSVEGGYGRTGSRSPMQWDGGKNAGFSSAPEDKLYIPLDPDTDRPTAESEMSSESSLRSEVKRLIEFRQSHAALQSRGGIQFVTYSGYPLVYERSDENEKLLVAINPSGEEKSFAYSEELGDVLYIYGKGVSKTGETVTVSGQTAAVIRIK
ncbi:MAG: glycosylase [Oscillospiraceae bacterium]|nr:glycosylase [Oscillospiraceae bacterium]